MGSDCDQIQGFWGPHFRGVQSLGKFIVIINIKNIIILVYKYYYFYDD